MDFYYKKGVDFDFNKGLDLEWLETNGLGGYSSSSILNCHTRKYHGFLVSELSNLPDKYVLLSKIDDFLLFEKKGQEAESFPLTCHSYCDVCVDQSFENLQEFIVDTHPQFIYRCGDVTLSKEILLLDGENTILVKYKVLKNNEKNTLKLVLKPLFAYRNFHALAGQNGDLNSNVEKIEAGYVMRPYQGMPDGFFNMNGEANFSGGVDWYRNFSHQKELERGFPGKEDLFSLGSYEVALPNDDEIIFGFSLEGEVKDLATRWRKEIVRRINARTKLTGSAMQQHLKEVAAQFITKRTMDNNLLVTAGYHWFIEWGRDAMVSLPGLCLHSGLENEFVEIAKNFARHEQDGLIPRYLGATKESNAYDSVDTSLFFVWALQQYYLKTRNLRVIEENFWSTLKNIFRNYHDGTSYDIKVGEDSLLYAGRDENVLNLTWMDVNIDNKSATPRNGAQVEINALWYNALCFIRVLALQFRDPIESELANLIPKTRTAFRDKFWDERVGFLKDFIGYPGNDNHLSFALRPNQIFAVSLPYSPLTQKMAAKVVNQVKDKLLTPYGLRTLAPDAENYVGTYEGDVAWHDRAYHNGTVWPWLLGHFTEAMLKVTDKKKTVTALKPCIEALEQHMQDYGGIGTISEIFSGDAPHKAHGCISQAWSVAEFLRITYILG